jgi:predicted aldo/keto reductase-like oxidoreductase
MSSQTSRRDFLHTGAIGVTTLGFASTLLANDSKNNGGIPLRPLGLNGLSVSVLGLGGHACTNPQKMSEPESVRLIHRAIDEGITFMDNAWDYHNGVAEERMGKALAEGGRRDKVFLMTKVCGRTAKEAASNLEDSLRRLRTDHIDLWQFHEIVYDNDPEWVFAKDGAIHTAMKALQDGKVRHIGFTGHKDPSIHLKMLAHEAPWTAVQMPLNVMDVHFRSFQKQVLPELLRRKIAPLAMKSLGGNGSIVTKAGISVQDAIRYVLSLPITTLISGIDSEAVLDQNLKIVREFKPMTEEERSRIEAKTFALAGDGRFELFKSSKAFDSPVHRKQHGFDVQIN